MNTKKRLLGAVLTVASVMAAVAFPATSSEAAVSDAWKRAPNDTELALLVLTNMARSSEPALLPLRWNAQLADAARYHSVDMAENDCFQHASCPPKQESWDKRVQSFYGGYTALGENIAMGSSLPQELHRGWMESPGHRSNILSANYTDFGSGVEPRLTNFGYFFLGTENFGSKGALPIGALPVIPGATVLPPDVGVATNSRQMLLNYYNYQGAGPDSVEAIVGTQRIALPKVTGTARFGTYGKYRDFNTCTPVYFEVKRGAQTFRYPETGTMTFGPLGTTCGSNPPGTTTTTGAATTTTVKPTTTTTTTVTPGGRPTVVIENPTVGMPANTRIKIRAYATDPDGVVQMEVYIDSKRVVRVANDTVTRDWLAGSSAVKPGPHTIEIRAKDSTGVIGTKSITLTK